MAKEYYRIRTQCIEFDSERLTMTVIMHDDKFTVMSVNTLNETEFQSQYYRFKADLYSQMVNQQAGISLSPADTVRQENTPVGSTFEEFVEKKEIALSYLNSMIFTSDSNQ